VNAGESVIAPPASYHLTPCCKGAPATAANANVIVAPPASRHLTPRRESAAATAPNANAEESVVALLASRRPTPRHGGAAAANAGKSVITPPASHRLTPQCGGAATTVANANAEESVVTLPASPRLTPRSGGAAATAANANAKESVVTPPASRHLTPWYGGAAATAANTNAKESVVPPLASRRLTPHLGDAVAAVNAGAKMKVVLFVDLTAITASNVAPAENKEPAVTVVAAATENLFVVAEENGTIAATQLEMVHPSITKDEDVLFLHCAKLIVIDKILRNNGTFQQKWIDHKRGQACLICHCKNQCCCFVMWHAMSNDLMATHILDPCNMLEHIQVHNKFELSVCNKSHVLTCFDYADANCKPREKSLSCTFSTKKWPRNLRTNTRSIRL
jgi:hypothetical protein